MWIDGIAQLSAPHLLNKPAAFQTVPKVPNFDKDREEALKYDGLPPLAPSAASKRTIVFTNVRNVFLRDGESIRDTLAGSSSANNGVVIVRDGVLVCAGSCVDALAAVDSADSEFVDLDGGAVSPALTSVGTLLGLAEIDQEEMTHDGEVFDALTQGVPALVGDALIRAADGLVFDTRDAL